MANTPGHPIFKKEERRKTTMTYFQDSNIFNPKKWIFTENQIT